MKCDLMGRHAHAPSGPTSLFMPGTIRAIRLPRASYSAFQAGAVYLVKKMTNEGVNLEGKTPALCRIEEAKFKGAVRPGDTVSIEVKYLETLQHFHFLTGTVRREGKAVLTLRFTLALVDQLS